MPFFSTCSVLASYGIYNHLHDSNSTIEFPMKPPLPDKYHFLISCNLLFFVITIVYSVYTHPFILLVNLSFSFYLKNFVLAAAPDILCPQCFSFSIFQKFHIPYIVLYFYIISYIY